MDPKPFDLDIRHEPDGRVRIAVHGELDLATNPRLHRVLLALGSRRSRVVLDFSDVSFMDLTSIALVGRQARVAAADGWCLTLDQRIPEPVGHAMRISGVECALPVDGPQGA